ncbi:calmodulin-binding protein 60 G isoform X2 [Cajanus cajan]|uniref:calmodulin-binding protein 60 G isoform X2 n=1 Tax=Cajanus cajan TaxID=3821 RepID=UPI00098DD57B|nr:calmodulin-binding protein 60 G isoform X2 [Cajanus cajan]
MASKRTFDEDDHQGDDGRDLHNHAKRRHGDPQQDDATNFYLVAIETVVRRVVPEIIQTTLQRYLGHEGSIRPSLNLGVTSRSKGLELCFVKRLPSEIFTLAKLTAEDGGPLQIELRYAASQQRVVTGEGSTMKVQICVLAGDFGDEDWTTQKFNAQILKPRDKGPLLKGNTVLKLKNGVGDIDKNLVFGDNSCWTKNKKFRLGVIILESSSAGADTREGKSEPFRVKDNRGVSYKKHERPSLDDEVWRLKNIAKEGKIHRQLSENGIKNVKDLLRRNTTGSLQESWVDRAKDEAYKNLKDLVKIEAPTHGTLTPYGAPDQDLRQLFLTQGQLDTWPSTSASTIFGPMQGEVPLNFFTVGQVVPEEANIDGGNGWENYDLENYIISNQSEQLNPNSFPYGDDGAESSKHSSFPNTKLSKGKSKTVWQKTRNVLKWVMPYMAKWKPKLLCRHY